MSSFEGTGPNDSDAEMRLESIRAALQPDPDRMIVRNEFAVVAVTVRDAGSARPRLLIEDLRTRQTVELDALELESLAWAQHKDLSPLLDPSRTRWANSSDE
ncbi:hypothetical protein [Streptomyces sp. NPDC086766]|uniref:hypothetical protein n=1 Tax=Streptomyces sp. NPDC086766 TaxID=3365754 RepID=UPI00382CDD58